MSYDLIVRGFDAVPVEQLRQMSGGEPWWEIDGDAGGVLLTNTNTGVYVNIAPADRRARELYYSVNFNRPRFFAREALLTLRELARRHGWNVYDPQREAALSLAPEEIDAMLASWQHANDAVAWETDGRPSLPRAEAERVWQWNYDRPKLEARLAASDRGLHVPKIFFVHEDGAPEALTMTFWPGGVYGMALPECSYLVYREEAGDAGWVVDRAALLGEAAYYVTMLPDAGVPALDAPRFSVLLGALQKAKRGPFGASIAASDQILER